MARVLIAGCGYVGAALGEVLLRDSHDVWGLRRKPRSLPAGIQPIEADLTIRTNRPTTVIANAPRPVPLDFEYRTTTLLDTIATLLNDGRQPIWIRPGVILGRISVGARQEHARKQKDDRRD